MDVVESMPETNMNTMVSIPLTIFLIVIATVTTAEETIVTSADAHVASGYAADTNYGDKPSVVSGSVDIFFFAYERFYLKFQLPPFRANTHISHAALIGYYLENRDTNVDDIHAFHLAALDGWTESGITWNNQPGPLGAAVAFFNPATSVVGSDISMDITPVVDAEYKGDGILSLCCKENNERYVAYRNSIEFFASKENPTYPGFRLIVTITPDTPQISAIQIDKNTVRLASPNLCVSASNVVEYTFDLASPSWQPISQLSINNDQISFTNSFPESNSIFYRIKSILDH